MLKTIAAAPTFDYSVRAAFCPLWYGAPHSSTGRRILSAVVLKSLPVVVTGALVISHGRMLVTYSPA
jgi:hypothetical protein